MAAPASKVASNAQIQYFSSVRPPLARASPLARSISRKAGVAVADGVARRNAPSELDGGTPELISQKVMWIRA